MYLLTAQRECEDAHYRPYNDVIGLFRCQEQAVQRAKQLFERTKQYMHGDECYMVEQVHFADDAQQPAFHPKLVFVIDRDGVETTTFEQTAHKL